MQFESCSGLKLFFSDIHFVQITAMINYMYVFISFSAIQYVIFISSFALNLVIQSTRKVKSVLLL